jgi:hypothetical protein
MGFADILYTVAIGCVGILATIVLSYVFALVLDRCCSSSYATAGERAFSRVSNEASIWGMGYDERELVLERVFANQKTVRTFHKPQQQQPQQPQQNCSSSSTPQQQGIEMVEMKSSSNTQSQEKDGVDLEIGIGMNGTPAVEEPKKIALKSDGIVAPDRLDDNLCSICLVEYGKILADDF